MKNCLGFPTWTLPFAMLLSCGGDETRDALPDWGAGYDDGDGGTGDGGGPVEGQFSIEGVDGIGIPTRIHRRDGLAITEQDCSIDIDGTREGLQEIFCQMEWNELDLWAYGLTFDFHVPAGACEWIVYWHYQYQAYSVEQGPSQVSWTVDDSGTFTNEVNSVQGVPVCNSDHSRLDDDAPNCCYGTYTLTVTDAETGETTVTTGNDWGGGGDICLCYDGAAFVDDEATFDDDGCPFAKYVFVNRQAFHKRFWLGSGADEGQDSIVFANYYDPADHEGTSPAAFRGPRSEPYYNFYCLDHAYEVLGSIRLIVREWNEEREFFADGDPDTEGMEPASLPLINDLWDWKDFTPDSTSFPFGG